MPEFSLSPGDHTIEASYNGYNTFVGTINVSPTGIITCKNIVGSVCGSSDAPYMTIVGSNINVVLKSIGSLSPATICTWIQSKGGWNKLAAYDFIELISATYGQTDLGFKVTAAHYIGCVAYYYGQLDSGNNLTGCQFT